MNGTRTPRARRSDAPPVVTVAAALAVASVALVLLAGIAMADANHWQMIRPGGRAPQALQWASFTHDPGRNQLLVFGGTDQVDELNDLWVLDLVGETWASVRPRGTLPYHRREAAMAFDAAGDQAVVFGGYYYDIQRDRPTYYDDTWLLELGGDRGPEWVKLPFTPDKPDPRRGATMVYQPGSGGVGRMVLFGGWDHVSSRGFNDVWAFDLTKGSEAWTELGASCTTKPVARDGHVAVYDPVGQRMVVFGGWQRGRSTHSTIGDLWAFDLSTPDGCWQELSPPIPKPPGLAWMSAVYDMCPATRRMIVFGGINGSGVASRYLVTDANETWALDLGAPGSETWTKLDPGGARPRPRDAHVAAYDPANRRMVIYSGWENEGELMRDVWALELEPCAVPTVTEEPTGTVAPTAIATSTGEPTASGTSTGEPTPTDAPSATVTSEGPATATPDLAATAIAGTLTAMAPRPTVTLTPDPVATHVAATLTAMAPSPAPSATPSATPDDVQTAVAATLTALAPGGPEPIHLPMAYRRW